MNLTNAILKEAFEIDKRSKKDADIIKLIDLRIGIALTHIVKNLQEKKNETNNN